MLEHQAHKNKNKIIKYSQYSKGLEKDIEKKQIAKGYQTICWKNITHKMLIFVCIQTNMRYILNHLLLRICHTVYKHQFGDFSKTKPKTVVPIVNKF